MELEKVNALDNLPGGLCFYHTVERLLASQNEARPWSPAVDIIETENELIIKADIPNVTLKDINIQLENGTLTLSGERRFETDDKVTGYQVIERSHGAFARSFTLSDTIDAAAVRASHADGVLKIILPKKEAAKARTITVNVN
jgi:HSP20 family protein